MIYDTVDTLGDWITPWIIFRRPPARSAFRCSLCHGGTLQPQIVEEMIRSYSYGENEVVMETLHVFVKRFTTEMFLSPKNYKY